MEWPRKQLNLSIMSSTFIWILVIAVMVLSMIIQNTLQRRFDKYAEVPLGITGAEVASRMLAAHGIRDVKIVSIAGKLTDHYDPTTRTVNLSENVYYGRSVAAAAVAAHECGHVVQHATGYAPLQMRSALVPVVSVVVSAPVKCLQSQDDIAKHSLPEDYIHAAIALALQRMRKGSHIASVQR